MSRFGRTPKAIQRTIEAATTYATSNNIIDIATLYGAGKDAKYVSIEILTDDTCSVKLNNDDDAVIVMNGPCSYSFNSGDIRVTSIKFDNSVSGATAFDVQVILGL